MSSPKLLFFFYFARPTTQFWTASPRVTVMMAGCQREDSACGGGEQGGRKEDSELGLSHQGHWANEHTAGAITITTGGTSSSTPNRREEDLLHNCHYGLFQQQQKQQEGWAPIQGRREENIFCITVINSYLDVNCLSQPTGIIIALLIKTPAFLQVNIVEFVPFYECFVKKN